MEFALNNPSMYELTKKVFESQERVETVTISKAEYENLLEDSKLLSYLQGAGVDNWEGYSDAIEMMDADGDK